MMILMLMMCCNDAGGSGDHINGGDPHQRYRYHIYCQKRQMKRILWIEKKIRLLLLKIQKKIE